MNLSFEDIVNHLSLAVIVANKQGGIEYMTPSAESLFGVSASKGIEQNLLTSPTSTGDRLIDWVNKTLKSGLPITYREVVIDLPEQGRSVTVDCGVSLLSNATSSTHVMIELSSLDRILKIAREEQLLSQQVANREMVRGMAHEIKNPLGGIRGAAQLLERELASDEQKEYTDIIISEVDRLQNLINRMLGSNKPPQKAKHNIHEIVEHVVRLVQLETGEALKIQRDYDPSLPDCFVDRDQMIQAILNIVKNACEAMIETGRKPKIKKDEMPNTLTLKTRAIRLYTIGQKTHRLVIALHIIDNGFGIPEHIQEHIFYPLVTGRSEGTGMGLPIAQNLVNKHEGVIECKSKSGYTDFTFYIPVNTLKA